MKSILFFVRSTLTGGILFLLPAVLLFILVEKGFSVLSKLSEPISKRLPEVIFGLDGSNLYTLFILLLLCFFAGLLFRSRKVQKWIAKLEENVLIYIPGYILIKSITADAIGEQLDEKLVPVLVQDGDSWNLGFLVEEGMEVSTVFLPDAPKHDAGEVKIVPSGLIRKLDMPNNKFTKCINTYGKGVIQYMPTK
ncbi:hypothetical protein [Robiginitalea marina]|uniref:DUF502 domain-containing protein n=1 Tax=Robiginitalea marina TaxID=2954105 RepID=A0ABT1AWV7_9FLAO|nr:hypothetical protein [Robiginitalea marina]MCO5724117.1 hypothetical protein [Robiginitalea marina]